MFSSNQIFRISGRFEDLPLALHFAMDMSNDIQSNAVFQITEDGTYCIGWRPKDKLPQGWHSYQFDFDADIVSKIIIQHLTKTIATMEDPYRYADGSSYKGFLMENIDNVFSDEWEGIKKPFYGIVSIKPFFNYYSK